MLFAIARRLFGRPEPTPLPLLRHEPVLDLTPDLVRETVRRPLAPPVSNVVPVPLARLEPDELARQLVRWFQDDAGGPFCTDAENVAEAYREMCAERGFEPRSWVKVGAEFNRLTGGKRYHNVKHPTTGRMDAKARHYLIPGKNIAENIVPLPQQASRARQPARVAPKAQPSRREERAA